MSILRDAPLAGATHCAFAMPALAQNISMELRDRQAIYIDAAAV
jgi:hypothetical protein